MPELPTFLKSGDIARLIPVIADSRKEQRVASVFLATLSAVPNFAEAMMRSLGQRVGRRTRINSFTEVVFQTQSANLKDRPDGLIVIDRNRSTWSALIEAKIGNNELEADQIERYSQLARDNGIDAVITISNQFAARPDHGPVSIPKVLSRKVDIYHWSWKSILTEAVLLQSQASVDDPDQAYLLREFIRFLSHDSIGVNGFTQMPSEWKTLILQLQSGAALKRNSPEVIAVVGGWHQEVRDIALRLSHQLSATVEVRLSRAHAKDPDQRFKDDCMRLVEEQILTAALQVPAAASDIRIVADLKSRTIRVGMEVDAPTDRQRCSARLNWLLRQFKDVDPANLFVRLKWPSRAKDTVCSLADLMEDPKRLGEDSTKVPRAFEISYVTTDSRRFSGRRTFIEELETALPTFYAQVGQHLQPWHPKPPKSSDQEIEEVQEANKVQAAGKDHGSRTTKQDSSSREAVPPVAPKQPEPFVETTIVGNEHTALLDIPPFLRRF